MLEVKKNHKKDTKSFKLSGLEENGGHFKIMLLIRDFCKNQVLVIFSGLNAQDIATLGYYLET